MTTVHTDLSPVAAHSRCLSNAAGLRIELLANGAIRRMDVGDLMLNLFVGNELEGGPANLWLRRHSPAGITATPLLGPASPLRALADPSVHSHETQGQWQGLRLRLRLQLDEQEAAWCWHLRVVNSGTGPQTLDLIAVQDVGLSPFGSARVNEYYVSHYIDLSPLQHPQRGCLLAARQNLAVDGRHPWLMLGSLRRGVAYATDALQLHGLALRTGALPSGIQQGLPGERLQHEHALLAVQDERLTVPAGAVAELGCFGRLLADHPAATAAIDLAWVDATLALAVMQPSPWPAPAEQLSEPAPRSLFASAPLLASQDLDTSAIEAWLGSTRRHEERDADGALLSFSVGETGHAVLRAKELRVKRPHGHLLHTGQQLAPDEAALTSTVWMGGVFHSMLTQGHVGMNRFLSTTRSWLGLFRSHGLRVFIEQSGQWQLLGMPSAFLMEPQACRWLYRHAGGLLEVCSSAQHSPHALSLTLRVLHGPALRLLVSQHVALGGDAQEGGAVVAALPLQSSAQRVFVGVPPGSKLAERFPGGGFTIDAQADSTFAKVGGDELLFEDGRSQGLPFVCITTAAVREFGLRIEGALVDEPSASTTSGTSTAPGISTAVLPHWQLDSASALSADSQRLLDILPWYRHNALIHFLAPRGLEQFTGGGWGTRDVCQGPLEMLLALDQTAPVRALLCSVFAAQNGNGDWPQWFMFFERDRATRADDSHGDIVFWPLLALARYLLASGDAGLLNERLPFYTAAGAPPDAGTLWRHVERALALIEARHITGTRLVAYGHGDWNDSLQPADPTLRENLCSAWTVTLHHQMLSSLAQALQAIGQANLAAPLADEAQAVQADFQRLLVRDGVVCGYALFAPGGNGQPQLLLHPDDSLTGVRYSLLPMMHAVLNNLLSPAQAAEHAALIETHLSGPDGARLFDRPLPYRGGPSQLFQRAETSAFFGREIGVMYVHAHLRFAEMLAHLGHADAFFAALCKAHPLGLRAHVPSASLRQANCYFSSSDAAFLDRYQAQQHYGQVAAGEVALDGGWRIYSSGPGIAIGLVVGSLLGVRRQAHRLILDPVMPLGLSGLRATLTLAGRELQIVYRLGGRGHGPTQVALNGQALPFSRGDNPYRVGAAELAMPVLMAALDDAAGALGLVLEVSTP